MAFKKTLHSLLMLSLVGGLSMSANADDANAWKSDAVVALTTEYVLELKAAIGAPVNVGKSDLGVRKFIPITGGSFIGKELKGEVIPGGADWQLTRPDGVLEVDALYSIRTDDDAVIIVHNKGIVARAVDEKGVPSVYVRTTPVFHAPEGKYDWLNKHIFTGTITPAKDGSHVVIKVFKIN